MHGLVSDDVARLRLFLATGARIDVPIGDNTYVVEVARRSFPIRLVAYDTGGAVVGISPFAHDPLADAGPVPVRGKQRVVHRVVGPNGTRGELRVGPSSTGGRCWRASFDGGTGEGGCPPTGAPFPAVGALDVTRLTRDSFVTGLVGRDVERVELRFASGSPLTTVPVDQFVLTAIPEGRRLVGAAAIGVDGRVLARKRFALR